MSLILCYCEKCGQHHDISDRRLNDLKNVICIGCGKTGYFKPVPNEYLNNGGWGINKELQEQFVESVIKSSPDFDQECWDRREAFDELNEYNNLKKANVPKCPTCSSTNIKKISVTSKAANTALFGLLGTKRYKTFHCNNCGYEW